MILDNELKELLQSGEIAELIRLPVEVSLIRKDGEKHMVAFVGGYPVFHYTYLASASNLEVRAALEYMRKNLWSAVFGIVGDLGFEAVRLPEYENRKKVVRGRAEDIGEQARGRALIRQQDEIKRREREAKNLRPIIKDHKCRVELLRRSLAAIAELRLKKRAISQKMVAQIVYGRQEVHGSDSAQAQYSRELREGFGRPASKTFEQLVAVNKTWEELTADEKSELNCPEVGRVNRKQRKSVAKKAKTV